MSRKIIPFKHADNDADLIVSLLKWSRPQHAVFMMFKDNPAKRYVDVAAELGLPVGTVKSRLNRARTRILLWRKERAALEPAQ